MEHKHRVKEIFRTSEISYGYDIACCEHCDMVVEYELIPGQEGHLRGEWHTPTEEEEKLIYRDVDKLSPFQGDKE